MPSPKKTAPEVVGPKPLLRYGDDDSELRVCPEGAALLQNAVSPLHVICFLGGSRCGKSTTANSIMVLEEGSQGFLTGDCFEPVTKGVDVAAQALPNGGTLILCDCEGAFHVCSSSSSDNARGLGALGFLAYHICSAVLYVAMGNIDERDIEALGHLAASVKSSTPTVGDSQDCVGTDVSGFPASLGGYSAANGNDSSDATSPNLLLLVNGARFALGEAVAKRILRPEPGARGCARRAIAAAFAPSPALEALPPPQHAAYWPKVTALRRRLLDWMPRPEASGASLVNRLHTLVGSLNAEASGTGQNASLGTLTDLGPASEALYRRKHLEPLVESLATRFAKEGRFLATSRDQAKAVEDLLSQFDRRAAWLTEGASDQPGGGVVRASILQQYRSQLEARAKGTIEAWSRRKSAIPQQLGSGSDTEDAWRSKAATWGTTPPVTPSTAVPSGHGSPQRPGSAAVRGQSVTSVETGLVEVQAKLSSFQQLGLQEVDALKVDLDQLVSGSREWQRRMAEEDRQAIADAKGLKDRLLEQAGTLTSAGSAFLQQQAAGQSKEFKALHQRVCTMEAALPDVQRFGSVLGQLRDKLEGERLLRREAVDAASRALEGKLKPLRQSIEQEASSGESLGARLRELWKQKSEDLQSHFEDEQRERHRRYDALSEVVRHMRSSLEASVDEAIDPLPLPRPRSSTSTSRTSGQSSSFLLAGSSRPGPSTHSQDCYQSQGQGQSQGQSCGSYATCGGSAAQAASEVAEDPVWSDQERSFKAPNALSVDELQGGSEGELVGSTAAPIPVLHSKQQKLPPLRGSVPRPFLRRRQPSLPKRASDLDDTYSDASGAADRTWSNFEASRQPPEASSAQSPQPSMENMDSHSSGGNPNKTCEKNDSKGRNRSGLRRHLRAAALAAVDDDLSWAK